MATNLRLAAAVRFEEVEDLVFISGPDPGLIDGGAKQDPIMGWVDVPVRPERIDLKYRVRSHGRTLGAMEARV